MLWLVIALSLFILQILIILIGEFRHPSKAMAWLFILFIVPVVGFVVYYFLAQEYRQRKKFKAKHPVNDLQQLDKRQKPLDYNVDEDMIVGWTEEPRLFTLLANIPGSLITRQNEVRVLTNAQTAYPAMLEAIESAERFVHFEFYIVRDDKTGRDFMNALVRKAREGVKVRCIFDGIGSYKLSDAYVAELRGAGCEVYFFLPAMIAFFDKRINYRNHRKIIVVDGKHGFLGGINIGDEYVGGDKKLGFWRDTHLAFSGDAVFLLQNTFLHDWHFVSGQRLADPDLYPEHHVESHKAVQIISSGPDAHWDAVLEMYFGAVTTAKKRIYITTPYFIPDPSLSMGLKTAATSGVDVRIIFPEVPDSRIVNHASLSYMEELMQAGVRFYAYQKGFIHAKVMIVDQLLATVGTANLDMRSFYNNFEINAVLFDRDSIRHLEADFLQDLKDSEELRLSEFEKRPRLQKAKEALARLLSPLM
ncbi:cardiolipin synthase [Paenibacillus sp. YYML68]|uniref:cardiolipin synthase n=1 Tax=Paenibacillus sp. YYML68 TaxID=2909250 RepID=UPI00249294D0|nr:cardiolipin synthase [Paenibacillus sp. YYML68]